MSGYNPVHWIGDAPTALHGNGAASFERTSRDVGEVTCRLCLTLLDRERRRATHQPAEPDAKQVGTSPEHANETPESWHVPDILDLKGYRADPHYDNGGSPQ